MALSRSAELSAWELAMALLRKDGGEMKGREHESQQGQGENGDPHLKGVAETVTICC